MGAHGRDPLGEAVERARLPGETRGVSTGISKLAETPNGIEAGTRGPAAAQPADG